ncbi:MAG: protein arginine kinase [Planctomycetota bacterium]
MQLSDFVNKAGEWMAGTGPDGDLVISSRIRLARNLEGHMFLSRANSKKRAAIENDVREALSEVEAELGLKYLELKGLNSVDRCVLMERHLISREHAFAKGERGVAYNLNEDLAIMINEEDHLRLQVLRSGFQLEDTWRVMARVDSLLEKRLSYAFDSSFGYLTVCPTNVGTGLRASVMLHLPALVLTRQIEKVYQAVTKINLAVRGLYGEGTQAHGDFYQISNQVTLGKTEAEIRQNLQSIIPQILEYERKVRHELVAHKKAFLEDKIWRAFGTLSHARTITSKETMDALSLARLGINLKILDSISLKTVNELFVLTQPGHLQKMEGAELDAEDRDVARAKFIRSYLEFSD